MNRRDFIKSGIVAGALAGTSCLFKKDSESSSKQDSNAANTSKYDLVAIKGGMPDKMFDAGIKAYGGMSRFVKKGQTVVVKPNIGWNKEAELAANTNPLLVKRVIEHCYEAGAKKVYVFDHPCDLWEKTYKNSGIENAVKTANGVMVPGASRTYYHEVDAPESTILKGKTLIHELILESDVFINIPVLKHHFASQLTIAMKNLMGIVWDRGYFHFKDLHQCIADICVLKKPDLNIVDAYYVMIKNGPRGGSKDDIVLKQTQLISTDIVAVDAAATKLFGSNPEDIYYIKKGFDNKLGEINLRKLKIKRLTI